MKKIRHKKICGLFNLVEVTMAIGIVGIGVVSVMALIQSGIQSSRNSVGDNYAPDIAEQFISYITLEANKKNDWYSSADGDTGDVNSDDEGIICELSTTKPTADDISYTTGNQWTVVKDSDNNDTNIYTSPDDGIFKVAQQTTIDGNNVVDFAAIVRIWKSKIENLYVSGVNNAEVPYKYGVALHVEVSWPVTVSYDRRQKRYYYIELFNDDPQ
jgi:type II secretory pathway pseudopilin PulG